MQFKNPAVEKNYIDKGFERSEVADACDILKSGGGSLYALPLAD